MRNPDLRILKVIDSHTGGEPTRIVLKLPKSVPELETGSLMDRRELMREKYDWIRTACLLEPRGHEAMVGALLCKPVDPSCVAGVIFFNNTGYLNGCIHGSIGLTVTLAHMGAISPGEHRIETPVGVITATLLDDHSVSIANVPSYRYLEGASVHVEGYGRVTGDVAWGGNWFFLIDGFGPEVRSENIPRLTRFTSRVIRALAEQGITGEDGMPIDHVETFGPPIPGVSDSRSFVLCPGLAYDRSPCGTGTSAKLACLYTDGKLEPDEIWRQASILDTVFEGRVEVLANGQVQPIISGSAYVNGESTFILDPEDPFQHGIPNT